MSEPVRDRDQAREETKVTPEVPEADGERLPSDISAPQELPRPKPAKGKASGNWTTSLESLLVTIIIAVYVITFLCQAFQIPSESMENTLLVGDYLLVDKVHFGNPGIWGKFLPYSNIKRGDIIVFRYPVDPAQHFVKRAIGIPGDRIRLVNGRVWVNGILQQEPFVIHKFHSYDSYRDDFPAGRRSDLHVESFWWLQMKNLVRGNELIVPQGQYFALGDNREESLDSRYWGLVPRTNIIGLPIMIYWSVKGADLLPGSPQDDKFFRFAYTVTHVLERTRWGRAPRIVR